MRSASAGLIALAIAVPAFAQTKPPVKKAPPAPPPVALKKVAPDVTCPTPLGIGVKTKIAFCEVLAGTDPAGGVIIRVPPHKGTATLKPSICITCISIRRSRSRPSALTHATWPLSAR